MRSYETKVFPGPGTEISLADKRDLGDRDHFCLIRTQLSRLAGKLSVYTLQNLHHSGKLYSASRKAFPHMNKTKLFDLSKCFLGNRDNFCPYELVYNLVWYVDYFSTIFVTCAEALAVNWSARRECNTSVTFDRNT